MKTAAIGLMGLTIGLTGQKTVAPGEDLEVAESVGDEGAVQRSVNPPLPGGRRGKDRDNPGTKVIDDVDFEAISALPTAGQPFISWRRLAQFWH